MGKNRSGSKKKAFRAVRGKSEKLLFFSPGAAFFFFSFFFFFFFFFCIQKYVWSQKQTHWFVFVFFVYDFCFHLSTVSSIPQT